MIVVGNFHKCPELVFRVCIFRILLWLRTPGGRFLHPSASSVPSSIPYHFYHLDTYGE